MAFYEVVGSKGKAGCDYRSADSLTDAKAIRDVMAKSDTPYSMIFIRQYRKDRRGGETFCVLHGLTVHP